MGFGKVKIDKNLLLSKDYGVRRYLKTGKIITCNICAKEVYSQPSTIGRKKYCSKECLFKGKPSKPKTGKYKNCKNCNKEVWVVKSNFKFNRTFCTQKCFIEFSKTRPRSKDLNCKECGKLYKQYYSQIRLRGSSFCSMDCMKKQKREKHLKRKSSTQNRNNSLKKQLWLYFSKFVRQRDGGVCISCGKVDFWKNMDAGHYIPKTYGLSIYFDERNVNCQCTGCNRFRHGNLSMYAIALRKKYGNDILEELNNKRQKITKISDNEYEELINIYKKKIIENNFSFS